MGTLFTNVRVFDGSGAPPYAGEVLVDGDRISATRSGESRCHGRRAW